MASTRIRQIDSRDPFTTRTVSFDSTVEMLVHANSVRPHLRSKQEGETVRSTRRYSERLSKISSATSSTGGGEISEANISRTCNDDMRRVQIHESNGRTSVDVCSMVNSFKIGRCITHSRQKDRMRRQLEQDYIRGREGSEISRLSIHGEGQQHIRIVSPNVFTQGEKLHLRRQETSSCSGKECEESHEGSGSPVRGSKHPPWITSGDGEDGCRSGGNKVYQWTPITGDAPPLLGLGLPCRKSIASSDASNSIPLVGGECIAENYAKWSMSKRGRRFSNILGLPSLAQGPIELLPSWKRSNRSLNDRLPLHAPYVKPMNEQLILDAKKWLSAERSHALDYLTNAELYPPVPGIPGNWPTSQLTNDEIVDMMYNDIVEECVSDDIFPAHFGYIFTVAEILKKRRRVVQDTLSANVLCQDPPKVQFTSIPRLKMCVHKGNYAVTFDVKAMYYQLLLSRKVRSAFRFKGPDGKTYRCKRLPMGFKWAVLISQSIMEFVANCVTARVHIEVYIDNVLFVGDRDQVRLARDQFLNACHYYSITLGEIGDVCQQLEFRGIQFDFAAKTVAISDKFVTKLNQRVEVATSQWADIRALISSVIYGLTIQMKLHTIFHLLKFMARHACCSARTPVIWWTAAKEDFDRALASIRSNAVLSPIDVDESVAIVSDAATETGLGAFVIVTPAGRVLTEAFPLSHYESINDMEALALLTALHRHPSLLSHRRIVYFGDNSAVLHCLISDHSKSFALNVAIGRITAVLHKLSSVIVPRYVPSDWNPADAPSRNEPFSYRHRQVLHFITALLRNTVSQRLRGVE